MSEDTRSPESWAAELLPQTTTATGRVMLHAERWRHDVAAILHGWTEHAHHAGAPLEMTRDDYELALLAVDDSTPHGPALSAHKGSPL